MKLFPAIVAAWTEIDANLQLQENNANARRAYREEKRYREMRSANDRAYFLLLFAHFEDHLNAKTRKLIDRKQGLSKWVSRRAWDVLDPNNVKNIYFKNRLSFCTDKRATDWNTISGYYEVRNDLAHAGSTARPFAIPAVASDLARIGGALRG